MSSFYSNNLFSSDNLPKNFYTLLAKILYDLPEAIQETTGKVPIGLLVTKPREFSDQVGILTHEGFDSLMFAQETGHFALSISPEFFKEGEIILEPRHEFCFREDNDQKFHYSNYGNILLPHQHVADLMTQLEGLILLQGYVSYGFLVADAGPDEEVRRLWSLIHSVETEYYNTTGLSRCVYLDVKQHPISLTPVNMIGEPDIIPLVLKGKWEVAMIHAEHDDLDVV